MMRLIHYLLCTTKNVLLCKLHYQIKPKHRGHMISIQNLSVDVAAWMCPLKRWCSVEMDISFALHACGGALKSPLLGVCQLVDLLHVWTWRIAINLFLGQRAIETELLLKFEHRQASDSRARSKLQGLVHCSFCGLACEVDPDIVDFVCPNKDCGKASCLKCKGASHKPFCCEEVEKPADTQIRNEVEELMSRSLIRECTTCKAQLVKDGGCNKLTCRCGSSICYVCRQPVKNYTHFCEHFRSAGESCRMCRKCGLWDKEDEVTIVQKAKKAALESKAKKSPAVLARAIGPAEELFISKRRKR